MPFQMPWFQKKLRLFQSKHGARWRVWDFMVGLTAFSVSFFVSPWHPLGTREIPQDYYLILVGGVYGIILMLMSRLSAVPNPEDRSSRYQLASSAAVAVTFSYTIFAVLIAILLVRTYGRWIVLTTTVVSYCGLFLPRFILMGMFRLNPIKVVIYGAGTNGRKLLQQLRNSNRFVCLGFLDVSEHIEDHDDSDVPILGSLQTVTPEDLRSMGVELLIISVKARNLLDANAEAIMHFPLHGIEVLNKGAFIEQYFKEVSVEYGCPAWFASTPSTPGNPSVFLFKRLLDIAAGTVGLLVTLPLWPLIAMAIKLSSRGPAFFLQERVGFRGQVFKIVKFRTMGQDAEKNGAQWAVHKDPRVTPVGRFLRMTRLDELPQFLNVVLGSMTLVGPRPERPEFEKELTKGIPYYEYRHLVPPGLTGWAQVMYKYGASKEDAMKKLQYDLYYVRHVSTMLDVEILLRTIPHMMKGSR